MSEPEKELTFDGDISALVVSAIQLNELFKSLIHAGFSKQEALHIAGMVMSSGMYRFEEDFVEPAEDLGLDIEIDLDSDDFGDEDFD
jgi:hypothetical protein